MRPLRYSINVTLDGCCHHEAGLAPDDESMRYWTAEMRRSDALLFGRVTYEAPISKSKRVPTEVMFSCIESRKDCSVNL